MDNFFQNNEKTLHTKKLLANSLIELSKTTPIERIHISDICAHSDLQRQSFYYHFNDKYQLIEWIFCQDFKYGMNHSHILNSEEMIYEVLSRMNQRYDFYKNIFSDNSQNNIKQYLCKLYLKIEISSLKQFLKTDTLDDDLLYEIESYSFATIEHHRLWYIDTNPMSLEELAHKFYTFMPSILKQAYLSLSNN